MTGRDKLKDLARTCGAYPSVWDRLRVTKAVHESLRRPPWRWRSHCTCGRCLGCLWAAYTSDLALLDDWDAGRVGWRDIDPGLPGPDNEGAMADELASAVAGDEDILLRGWPALRAVKACA